MKTKFLVLFLIGIAISTILFANVDNTQAGKKRKTKTPTFTYTVDATNTPLPAPTNTPTPQPPEPRWMQFISFRITFNDTNNPTLNTLSPSWSSSGPVPTIERLSPGLYLVTIHSPPPDYANMELIPVDYRFPGFDVSGIVRSMGTATLTNTSFYIYCWEANGTPVDFNGQEGVSFIYAKVDTSGQ